MILCFFFQILNARAEDSIEDKFNSITPEQGERFKVPSELNAVVVAGNPGALAGSLPAVRRSTCC
jgi:hypothetical protein